MKTCKKGFKVMQFDNVLPCVHSDFNMFQMSIAQLNTYYFSLICGVDCFCHKKVIQEYPTLQISYIAVLTTLHSFSLLCTYK